MQEGPDWRCPAIICRGIWTCFIPQVVWGWLSISRSSCGVSERWAAVVQPRWKPVVVCVQRRSFFLAPDFWFEDASGGLLVRLNAGVQYHLLPFGFSWMAMTGFWCRGGLIPPHHASIGTCLACTVMVTNHHVLRILFTVRQSLFSPCVPSHQTIVLHSHLFWGDLATKVTSHAHGMAVTHSCLFFSVLVFVRSQRHGKSQA
ncbi:uncharacterized protein B0H64DRAFT_92953 [Chaetomium fimeti]|uniref:Uncharacterized protein n=1 Tax=Chaetomium fimeti TaxID=1854472 RepID=A0AAE0HMG1_9PEZI|nr:hypothetical protein B0H64DRAFT_92953 [Chaetomium fimeti]